MNTSYDANNRVASGNGIVQDAAGNITSDSTGGSAYTYTYDAENRIVSVGGAVSATYTYDADGRRVKKLASGTGTEYFYDLGGNNIAEINSGTGGLNRAEIFAGGSHIGSYVAGSTFFAYSDWMGTERVRTNYDSGATIAQYCEWTAFGEFSGCSNSYSYTAPQALSAHNFAGYERDAETGLDHTWFRYYNSRIGRWMSTDPYNGSMNIGNPQSLNRYAYAGNDPIDFNDPSGLLFPTGPPLPPPLPPNSEIWGGLWGVPGRIVGPVYHIEDIPDHIPPDRPSTQCELKAMLDAIAFAEGTSGTANNNGYGTVVRGTVVSAPFNPELIGKTNVSITDFSRHPDILVQVNSTLQSTAAGRYQFKFSTWQGLKMPDFTPQSQDQGAIKIMQLDNMIKPLLAGDISQATQNGNRTWASLPGSKYNQPTKTQGQIDKAYQDSLNACTGHK